MAMSSLDRTCKASQLVARLLVLMFKYGDLPVYARDPDSRYRLPIGLMYRKEDPGNDRPARFEITTDYHDRPRADFSPTPP